MGAEEAHFVRFVRKIKKMDDTGVAEWKVTADAAKIMLESLTKEMTKIDLKASDISGRGTGSERNSKLQTKGSTMSHFQHHRTCAFLSHTSARLRTHFRDGRNIGRLENQQQDDNKPRECAIDFAQGAPRFVRHVV